MKLLLVSHGTIAKGYYETVTNFFGAREVYYANVNLETGVTGLVKAVDEYLNQWGDETVVICSDLKGGSANQTVTPCITRPNTYLISGMNLSLVLQLALATNVDADSLSGMIESARGDIVLVNNELLNNFDEDDE